MGTERPLLMRTFLFFAAIASLAAAQTREFSSGESRTHLIELYTSEGCSSCPPAEAWIASLRDQPGLWRDFIPLAWHVGYWDRLGWKDRFALVESTERQKRLARWWGSTTLYTPALALNAGEWRQSRRVLPSSRDSSPGVLKASYADGRIAAEFAAQVPGDYEVHAAILGGGIVSDVTRGENSGRTLRHDFVVLSTASGPLADGLAELTLPVPRVEGVGTHALAVWVTRRGSIVPLQATGGPLARKSDD